MKIDIDGKLFKLSFQDCHVANAPVEGKVIAKVFINSNRYLNQDQKKIVERKIFSILTEGDQ